MALELNIEDENGNLLTTVPLTLRTLDTASYDYDVDIDNSGGEWSGKIRIYVTGVGESGGTEMIGITDVTCDDNPPPPS